MTALSPSERKALKARAHHLGPVVLIGDAGLTPAVLREINVALDSHELIKVRMAGDDRTARAAAYDAICTGLGCSPVQHIGKLMVLYRPRPAGPANSPAGTVSAKPRRPAGPRKTKKQLAQRLTSADSSPAQRKPAGQPPGSKATSRTTARKAPTRAGRLRRT